MKPRAPDHPLWHNFLILAGRVLIGWLYVESGFRKLLAMDPFIASLTRRNVPWATVWGWIGALIEFLGGLALLLGAFTRCAALAILAFTIVATLIGRSPSPPRGACSTATFSRTSPSWAASCCCS